MKEERIEHVMSDHETQAATTRVVHYLAARRSQSTSSLRAYFDEYGPFPLPLARALAVAELEYRWETQDARPVEWVLTQVPELRDDAQTNLELIDVELRWMQSEPERAAYLERFPELAEELDRLFDLVSLGPQWADHAKATSLAVPSNPIGPDENNRGMTTGLEPTGGTAYPDTLGRYQILQRIGRGGFGEVFAAWDPQLERKVAVKRLHPGSRVVSQAGPGADLLVEARRVALLDHRAIVPVYDIGEQDGALFVVSRLINGKSLEQQQPGSWPWRHVAKSIARIADALAYAHARGIIHRDIKPANVLVDSDGLVFLNDFGLALLSDSLEDRPTHLVGTLPYLAPELLNGSSHASVTTDVFSLGVIFYQLLTGHLPWNAREINVLKRLHAQGEAAFPEASKLDYPPAILAVCRRAVQRDPAQRHPSAAYFARDLRRAMRVGQDHPSDFASEPFAAKLPASLTSLVGRDHELDWLRENVLQRQRRLITMTGMGGVGKSRLALELGWEIAEELGNRIYFVELAMVNQASLVLPRILESLAVPESQRESPLATLAYFFGKQRSLLLLDNFEQVLSAGPQLTLLLERCPGLQIVITSRIALGIRGEQVLPLAPLEQPDSETVEAWATAEYSLYMEDSIACASVELFVQRARQVCPDFQLDPTNLKTVCNLCRRLDGLPLAIELAASRLASFSLLELETRLTRRRLLTQVGPSDLPTRQRTLGNTIQWSVDLLSPKAREIFSSLSLFGGGATRAGIEAIFHERDDLAVSPDWEAACDEIIGSNLVRIDRTESHLRWNMLETVREFARIEFDKQPERGLRLEAFGQFYAQMAETAAQRHTSAEQVHWLKEIENEYGNFRSMLQESVAGYLSAEIGLRVAAALWWYWETRGMFEEGLFWLRSLITPDPEVSPVTLAAACNAYGNLARNRGRIDDAEKHYQRAWSLRMSIGDQRGVSGALLNLGNIALERGDWLQAEELYQQSLAIRRAIGDDSEVAMALSNLALTAMNLEKFSEAEGHIAESQVRYERCGDRRNLARVIDIRGQLTRARGNDQDAIGFHAKALMLREQIGDRLGIGLSHDNLARSYLKAGMPDAAETQLLESLAILQQIGADGRIPDTLELASELACLRRQFAESAQLLAVALKLSSDGAQIASHPRLQEIAQYLNAEVIDQAITVGQAMSLDAACAFARSVLRCTKEKPFS
jgi:predicted ATPase